MAPALVPEGVVEGAQAIGGRRLDHPNQRQRL
jgi:hypothetical protein